MGIRITSQEGVHALYDSVSGFAFGPVFSSEEDAEDFCLYYREQRGRPDLRLLSDVELEAAVGSWRQERDDAGIVAVLLDGLDSWVVTGAGGNLTVRAHDCSRREALEEYQEAQQEYLAEHPEVAEELRRRG